MPAPHRIYRAGATAPRWSPLAGLQLSWAPGAGTRALARLWRFQRRKYLARQTCGLRTRAIGHKVDEVSRRKPTVPATWPSASGCSKLASTLNQRPRFGIGPGAWGFLLEAGFPMGRDKARTLSRQRTHRVATDPIRICINALRRKVRKVTGNQMLRNLVQSAGEHRG